MATMSQNILAFGNKKGAVACVCKYDPTLEYEWGAFDLTFYNQAGKNVAHSVVHHKCIADILGYSVKDKEDQVTGKWINRNGKWTVMPKKQEVHTAAPVDYVSPTPIQSFTTTPTSKHVEPLELDKDILKYIGDEISPELPQIDYSKLAKAIVKEFVNYVGGK